jgi:hypothetical protein
MAGMLRSVLGIVAGTAVGGIAAVFWMGIGIAFGWALVFGDGNGHERWFMPALAISAAGLCAICSGLGYWIATPAAHRRPLVFLLVSGTMLAVILVVLWHQRHTF